MLRDENNELIQRCQKAADDVAAKTERGLQDRIDENQGCRNRLSNEIAETRAKIDHTKETMAETRAQIRALVNQLTMQQHARVSGGSVPRVSMCTTLCPQGSKSTRCLHTGLTRSFLRTTPKRRPTGRTSMSVWRG